MKVARRSRRRTWWLLALGTVALGLGAWGLLTYRTNASRGEAEIAAKQRADETARGAEENAPVRAAAQERRRAEALRREAEIAAVQEAARRAAEDRRAAAPKAIGAEEARERAADESRQRAESRAIRNLETRRPATSEAKPPPPVARPSARDAVDNALKSLAAGAIAFNAPTPIRSNTAQVVQLLVSLEKDTRELIDMVQAQGVKEGAEAKIAPRMRAELAGMDFNVTPLTPVDQAIGSEGVTEWRWQVRPTTQKPKALLHLTLSAIFPLEGSTTQHVVKTFEKWIDVEITFVDSVSEFAQHNWQWLWATILVPIAGWAWRKYRSPLRPDSDRDASKNRPEDSGSSYHTG